MPVGTAPAPAGTVALQHASIIKTVADLFGLDGPLNERDRSAASFAALFTRLDAPRPKEEMPAALVGQRRLDAG